MGQLKLCYWALRPNISNDDTVVCWHLGPHFYGPGLNQVYGSLQKAEKSPAEVLGLSSLNLVDFWTWNKHSIWGAQGKGEGKIYFELYLSHENHSNPKGFQPQSQRATLPSPAPELSWANLKIWSHKSLFFCTLFSPLSLYLSTKKLSVFQAYSSQVSWEKQTRASSQWTVCFGLKSIHLHFGRPSAEPPFDMPGPNNHRGLAG